MPAKKATTAKPTKPPARKPQEKGTAGKGKRATKDADEDLEAAADESVSHEVKGKGTKTSPKQGKQVPRMAPSLDEDDDSDEENVDDEERPNIPSKRGKPIKPPGAKLPAEEGDDLGESGEGDDDDEDVEVEEGEEDEKDLEEIDEKIPCDFCTKNSTHACFNCGKNGCDDHVLTVMIWVKKGKGRSKKKEKQSAMCCIDCVSNVEVVDEEDEEEDEWGDAEEDEDEETEEHEGPGEDEAEEEEEDDEEEEDEDELLEDDEEEDDFFDDDDDDEGDDDEFY